MKPDCPTCNDAGLVYDDEQNTYLCPVIGCKARATLVESLGVLRQKAPTANTRKTIDQEVEEFIRKRIAEDLATLSAGEQALFQRIYPTGPLPEQLRSAWGLIKRSIASNEKKAQEGKSGQ